MQTPRPAVLLFALSPLALAAAPAQACSCSACSALSDQEAGDWGIPENYQAYRHGPFSGFRADLRYDFVTQDRLRSGSGTASIADVNNAIGNGTLGELERKTTTQTTTLGLDYVWADDVLAAGVNVQVPWIVRNHSTIDAATLGGGSFAESHSYSSGLGDVKIVGRAGFRSDFIHSPGVLLGLKLPTGQTDDNFSSGPLANTPLDRSLQLGTGSTDLILGTFHGGEIAENWEWFAQGTWQTALATKDDFRPGDTFALNAGVRFTEFKAVTPQLQVNVRHTLHDTGANADPENTGSTSVLLSPGVTVALSERVKVYGMVQLPLWQEVRGIQLTSAWNASVGISVGF